RKREVADRENVRIGIADTRVPAAIAERVELLDVPDRKRGLLSYKGAKREFERAVHEGVERARGQADRPAAIAAAGHQNLRLGLFDGDDCRREPDFDGRTLGSGHVPNLSRNRTKPGASLTSGSVEPEDEGLGFEGGKVETDFFNRRPHTAGA